MAFHEAVLGSRLKTQIAVQVHSLLEKTEMWPVLDFGGMLRRFGKCHLDGDVLKFSAGLNIYGGDTSIFGCRAIL